MRATNYLKTLLDEDAGFRKRGRVRVIPENDEDRAVAKQLETVCNLYDVRKEIFAEASGRVAKIIEDKIMRGLPLEYYKGDED